MDEQKYQIEQIKAWLPIPERNVEFYGCPKGIYRAQLVLAIEYIKYLLSIIEDKKGE